MTKCLPASRGGLEPKRLECPSVPVAVASIFPCQKGEMLANFSRGSCRPVVAPRVCSAFFLRSRRRTFAEPPQSSLGPRISRTFQALQPENRAGRFQPKIRGSNFEGQSFCWDFGREFSRPNFPLPSRAAPPLAPPSPGHAVPTRAGAYAVRPRGYHQALAYGLALVPHYAPCIFFVSCQDASSGTGSEP